MVWLAAGGTTVILGYVLYRCCLVRYAAQTYKVPVTPRIQEPDDLINEDQSVDKTSGEERGNDETALPEWCDNLPSVQKSSHAETTHNGAKAPATSMLPPPIRPPSPLRLKPPTITPSPPRPHNATPLRPPPSAASSLRIPPTKVLSSSSMGPSSLMPPPKSPSRKVMLEPGHSPLDWALLTSSPTSKLRGQNVPDHLVRVTPSMLKYHTGRQGKDTWTAYQGKVYNITPYLKFHPGGVSEIMKGAGRDSAKLFLEVHPWVNWEGMLGECMIGILVSEGDRQVDEKSGGLDEMD